MPDSQSNSGGEQIITGTNRAPLKASPEPSSAPVWRCWRQRGRHKGSRDGLTAPSTPGQMMAPGKLSEALDRRNETRGMLAFNRQLSGWAKIPIMAPLLALCAFFLIGCASVERSYQANLFLHDIQAQPDDETWLKRRTDEPSKEEISFEINDAEHQALLYRPYDSAAGSIVLVPGLIEEGINDQRLKGFAESLARLGYRVMLPNLADTQDMRWGPESINRVSKALSHMANRDGSQQLPLGAVAMSAMGAPTLVAVAEDDFESKVDFVALVGSYYDLKAWVEYVTTGYDSVEGSDQLTPEDGLRWQLLKHVAHWQGSDEDREWLSQMVQRRQANPEATIDVELSALSSGAASVAELMINEKQEDFARLYDELAENYRDSMARLDLSERDWDEFQPDLILIHGTRDRIIPFSHSVALSEAVPDAKLYRITGLSHTELDPGRFDSLRLWRAAAAILDYRVE